VFERDDGEDGTGGGMASFWGRLVFEKGVECELMGLFIPPGGGIFLLSNSVFIHPLDIESGNRLVISKKLCTAGRCQLKVM